MLKLHVKFQYRLGGLLLKNRKYWKIIRDGTIRSLSDFVIVNRNLYRDDLDKLGSLVKEDSVQRSTDDKDNELILGEFKVEVIVNGDAPAVIASASAGTEGPIPPKTAKQKLARKNKLKEKSTLLLDIPDEHLLKFHGIKDAKILWEAIKARSEGLDKTYDRFQKLISQLEIYGEVISQEDANLKLLRSLLSAWNTHTLIMRNKFDLDTLSMDDLYNNLKVY
ncbi:hypothetical protein Tco_0393554 [Tanacetum coccineum]